MRVASSLLALLCACAASRPPAAAADAPALESSALDFSVLILGRPAGLSTVRVNGNQRDAHYEFNDRGRGPSLDTHYQVDPNGVLQSLFTKGHDYLKSPVEERFDGAGERRWWSNKAEQGSSSGKEPALYAPLYAIPETTAVMARALLKAPGNRLPLLPSGESSLSKVEDRTVQGVHVTQYALDGFDFQAARLWLDDRNELFGSVGTWFALVRKGFEKTVPELLAAQDAAVAAHLEELARSLGHQQTGPIAITHAQVFDAQAKVLIQDTTILIEDGRISKVGPSSEVAPPAGATTIDAAGKTVVPGLWDMHVHAFDGDGLLHLANGVTTVRDLANEMDKIEGMRKRFESGVELGPHLLLAGFIDGRGPFTGPTKVFADNEAEAKAAIDKYAERGYLQIKVYSSLKPELVPFIARYAHEKGLRLSGHVPAHMIAEDAVRGGFDELQHMNFVLLEFIGDRGTDTHTMLRLTLPAEKAAGLDLNSKQVADFVALLLEKGTVVDPTLGIFETQFLDRPGQVSSLVRALADRLPPQVKRGYSAGGLPVKDAEQGARYKKSWAKFLEMTKLLWSRGVPLVAGTDAIAGFGLMRELELYAEAGIPNADVLYIATLGAAKVMKRDARSGSISAGKDADLVIVDGDPLADISALRKPVLVMKGGTTVKPAELLRALHIETP